MKKHTSARYCRWKHGIAWLNLVPIETVVEVEEIARTAVKGAANVLDRSGLNPISVQVLMLFDFFNTDTSAELLRELFSEKHSMDETVRIQVLKTLNGESEI